MEFLSKTLTTQTVLALLFFMGGIIPLVYFIKIIIFHAFTVKKWNETTGEVIEYNVEPAYDRESWEKKLHYMYFVNGKIFTNSTLTKNLILTFSSKEHTHKYYDDYHIGQKITVKYNPADPQNAVVEYRFSAFNILYLIFSLGAFAVASYIYF